LQKPISGQRDMSKTVTLPPGVGRDDRVILFDGVCKLCSAWSRFLIRFDSRKQFKLATVQSPEGRAILEWFGLSVNDYDTMVLVKGSAFFTKSSAVIRILWCLPLPWPLLCAGWLVPRFIRNWLYDCVARNRYRWFGQYSRCVQPAAKDRDRFLQDLK